MKHHAYFIDSNIFLRFYVREYKKITEDCARLFALIKDGKIKAIANDLILAEIEWTLRTYYKIPKVRRTEYLASILGSMRVQLNTDTNIEQALVLYKNNKVKLIDAMIASMTSVCNGSITVISYDKDFDKLGVKRAEPNEIVRLYDK